MHFTNLPVWIWPRNLTGSQRPSEEKLSPQPLDLEAALAAALRTGPPPKTERKKAVDRPSRKKVG